MKKLFVALFVMLMALPLVAQSVKDPKGFRFGMQLTPTISWMTSDELDLMNPDGAVMGYSYGLMGDWFFNKNYAIATGLFMNSMGGKIAYDVNGTMPLAVKNSDGGYESPVGQVTLKSNYLEVPIGLKFLSKQFWRIRFSGQCGYNQMVLLNAKVREGVTLDAPGSPSIDLEGKDVGTEFSIFNAAYHFGFGVEYSLGGDTYVTASVLAVMGIMDVTKTERPQYAPVPAIDPINKINSINFKTGIIF